MTAYEGELLPAVRSSSPEPGSRVPVRHAVCGYDQQKAMRSGMSPYIDRALCDALVLLPLYRHEVEEKCQPCLDLAQTHGLECDCWKLWPNGKVPRR